MSLTCKIWNTAANSLLYRQPILSTGKSLLRLKYTVILTPTLALLIYGLTLLDHPQGTPWQQYRNMGKTIKDRESARLAFKSLLPLCPNLTEYHSSYTYPDDPMIFSIMRPRIFDAPSIPSLTSLRSLILDGFQEYLGVASRSGSIVHVLPGLEELVLNDLNLGGLRTLQCPGLRSISVTNCSFLNSDLSQLLNGSKYISRVILCHSVNTLDGLPVREPGQTYIMLLQLCDSLRELTLQGHHEWNIFALCDWSMFTSLSRMQIGRTARSYASFNQLMLPESLSQFTWLGLNRWGPHVISTRTDIYVVKEGIDRLLDLHISNGWTRGTSFDLVSNRYEPFGYVLAERKIWVYSASGICK